MVFGQAHHHGAASGLAGGDLHIGLDRRAAAFSGALIGTGFDYSAQVFLNHCRGLRGWDAWLRQIDRGQIGCAALFGLALNIVTRQPWHQGLAGAGLLGAAVGRVLLRTARAVSAQKMTQIIHLDNGGQRSIRFQELSGWAQGVICPLEQRGWVRVSQVPLSDLTDVSMFFGREIGVLQSGLDGRLRLVLGGERGIAFGQARPGEIFVAHTHPIFRSLLPHFQTDIANAGKHTELVLDWSGQMIFFNKRGVLNPILDPLGQQVIQPHPSFQPCFVRNGTIIGFPHIRPIYDRLGRLLHHKVTP